MTDSMTSMRQASAGPAARGRVRSRAQRIGIAILALAPAIIVMSREAVPVVTALAAIAFAFGAGSRSAPQMIASAIIAFLRSPTGLLVAGALMLLVASVTWTPATARGALHAAHMVGSALLIMALLIAVGHADRTRPLPLGWIAAGYALAALLLIANVATNGLIRASAGLAAESFRFNRGAVTLALLMPLVCGHLLWRRSRPAALITALTAAIAVAVSASTSAQLALVIALITWAIARSAPVLAHRAIVLAMVAMIAATPFAIGHVNDAVPAFLHQSVGYYSLTIRGEIWREFAALYWLKPWLGFGIEASYVIVQTPVAAGLSEKQLYLLNFGHPHNNVLQVFFELGALGAALAAGLVMVAARAVERLPESLLPLATATMAATFAVAYVSHGAWQAWWPCLVALVAAGFRLATPGDEA